MVLRGFPVVLIVGNAGDLATWRPGDLVMPIVPVVFLIRVALFIALSASASASA